MNGHYLEDGQRSKGLRRKLLCGGVVLLGLFWLAAMPLPGPLSRARELVVALGGTTGAAGIQRGAWLAG